MIDKLRIKSGQAAIMLMIIIMLLVTLTTAAVAIAISTTLDTTTQSLGERSLTVAESGAENAILRLLRDPSYTGESGLSIGPGTATISVVGTAPYVIVSTGTVGNFVRQIQVTVTTVGGSLTVSDWQEL